MSTGLSILNDSSYIQIDENFRNLQLVRVIPLTIPTGDSPASWEPMSFTFTGTAYAAVAIRNKGSVYISLETYYDGGSSYKSVVRWSNSTGAAVTMYAYVFDLVSSGSVPAHGQGIEIFDGGSNPIYLSSGLNMSVSSDFANRDIGMVIGRQASVNAGRVQQGPWLWGTYYYRVLSTGVDAKSVIMGQVGGQPPDIAASYLTIDLTNFPYS